MIERHVQMLPERKLLPSEEAIEALAKGEVEPARSIEEAVHNAQELLEADLKEIQRRSSTSGVYVHKHHFHKTKD